MASELDTIKAAMARRVYRATQRQNAIGRLETAIEAIRGVGAAVTVAVNLDDQVIRVSVELAHIETARPPLPTFKTRRNQ